LEYGADPSLKDSKGRTALHLAVLQRGNSEIIKKIMQARPDIVNEKDDTGKTALHLAVEKSNSQTIALILGAESVQVDEKDNQGKTALYRACEKPLTPPDIVKKLLNAGAKVDDEIKGIAAATKSKIESGTYGAVAKHYITQVINELGKTRTPKSKVVNFNAAPTVTSNVTSATLA